MRRTLAIVLLLLLCWPMAASALALAQGADAGLPACCRRNGAHHCAGSMQENAGGMQAEAGGMAMEAAAPSPHHHMAAVQPRCPACPPAVTSAQVGRAPAGAQTLLPSPHLASLAAVPQTEARARIALDRSRHKRGPPSQQI